MKTNYLYVLGDAKKELSQKEDPGWKSTKSVGASTPP